MVFLETRRLRLRNVEPKDAKEIFDYRNHELCAKYQRDQTKDFAGIVDLVQKRKNDTLTTEDTAMIAVAWKDTDAIIGEIVVMPNMGTVSLGYTFSYKIHRQGCAFEALTALTQMLHGQFPEWDFVCFTEVGNAPSRNLLKKLGFTDCGYLPAKDSRVFGKWLREDSRQEIMDAVQVREIGELSPGRETRVLTEEDLDAVLELMAGNPLFYRHCPPVPTRETVCKDMKALPPRTTYEDKFYVGIFENGQLLAVVDLIFNYPNMETAFIGFFMVNAACQGRGTGSELVGDIAGFLRKNGYRYIRLGYVKTNPQSRAFWLKNGFAPTGVETDTEDYTVVVMEKAIFRAD